MKIPTKLQLPRQKKAAGKVIRFEVPYSFTGAQMALPIYVGNPNSLQHPIFFQNNFISQSRGGVADSNVMESLQKMHEISAKHGIPLYELCYHALLTTSVGGSSPFIVPEAAEAAKKLANSAVAAVNLKADGEEPK